MTALRKQHHHASQTEALFDAVEHRLSAACTTLRRLRMVNIFPSKRMSMCDLIFISGEVTQGYGYVATVGQPSRPSPAEISAMDQVLQWMLGAKLSLDHRRLLWLRAEGRGWRSIGNIVDLDHMTVKRRYTAALEDFIGYLVAEGQLV